MTNPTPAPSPAPSPSDDAVANTTIVGSAAAAAASTDGAVTPSNSAQRANGPDQSMIDSLTDRGTPTAAGAGGAGGAGGANPPGGAATNTPGSTDPADTGDVRALVESLREEIRQLKSGATLDPADGDPPIHESLRTLFTPDAPIEDVEGAFMRVAVAAGVAPEEARATIRAWREQAQPTQPDGGQPGQPGDRDGSTGGVRSSDPAIPDDPYVRELLREQIHQKQDAAVEAILESDGVAAGMFKLKEELEGAEAANAAKTRFRAAIIKRANDILNDKVDTDPSGRFNMKWIAPAIREAYNAEVEFLKTVAVNPDKIPGSTGAAIPGADILNQDPVEYPDPTLLASGKKEEYVARGLEVLKDRARRARAAAVNQASRDTSTQA